MSHRSTGPRGDTQGGEVSVEDVLEELEELEVLVDSDEERDQVGETMRVLRRVEPRRSLRRLRASFDSRDVSEQIVGSFVFGIPMVVEDGTLEIGEFIGEHPL